MILLSILFSSFVFHARAEVISERFIVIGNHKKEIVTLREHKIKSGKGFSVTKSYSTGRMTGHTLSPQKYLELKTELEKSLKTMIVKPARSIASCDDTMLVGQKTVVTKAQSLKVVCLEQESLESRKKFARWWRKISQDL
jgi:hypothetical protein